MIERERERYCVLDCEGGSFRARGELIGEIGEVGFDSCLVGDMLEVAVVVAALLDTVLILMLLFFFLLMLAGLWEPVLSR